MKKIAIVMGSISDWDTMKHAAQILDELNVDYVKKVISAHRMPDEMFSFAKNASKNGIKVIIAGAGGAAHLPGMIAANTLVPVIGVPVQSHALDGLDSLLSIVQMPAGVSVATMAIGKAGAQNAALMAAQILGINDQKIEQRLTEYRERQTSQAIESSENLE